MEILTKGTRENTSHQLSQKPEVFRQGTMPSKLLKDLNLRLKRFENREKGKHAGSCCFM